jgi:uncharacterized protein YdaL
MEGNAKHLKENSGGSTVHAKLNKSPFFSWQKQIFLIFCMLKLFFLDFASNFSYRNRTACKCKSALSFASIMLQMKIKIK